MFSTYRYLVILNKTLEPIKKNEINKCSLQWHFHRVALHPLNPSWNLEVLIFAEGGKTA
jgi:hypothetical protein